MTSSEIHLTIPPWLPGALPPAGYRFASDEEKMRFVIRLARENVERRTGGPFGAAVFAVNSGRLVAAGVNAVITTGYSLAHAEMLALALAQKTLGTHDLSLAEGGPCELVTSVEPCAMCLGAIPWSGVRRVICGAREEDAAAIGFDEGPKHPNWPDELAKRGITLVHDLCREEAADVLRAYAETGGMIYNAGERHET